MLVRTRAAAASTVTHHSHPSSTQNSRRCRLSLADVIAAVAAAGFVVAVATPVSLLVRKVATPCERADLVPASAAV